MHRNSVIGPTIDLFRIPNRTHEPSVHGILPPLVCYYITAVLVQLPASSTWLIRVALLPMTLYSAFWAATAIDFSASTASMSGWSDPGRYAFVNQGVVVSFVGFCMHILISYTDCNAGNSDAVYSLDISHNTTPVSTTRGRGFESFP